MISYPLLWKEFTLRRKAWILTPIEFLLMLFSVWMISVTFSQEQTLWDQILTIQEDSITGNRSEIHGRIVEFKDNLPYVVYYPSVPFTDNVMRYGENRTNGLDFSRSLSGYDIFKTQPLKNEMELEEYVTKYNSRVAAAFTFYEQKTDKYLTSSSNIANGIHIKLRSTFFVVDKRQSSHKTSQSIKLDLLKRMLSTIEQRAVGIQLNLSNDIQSYYYNTTELPKTAKVREQFSAYNSWLSFGTIITLFVLVNRIVTEKTTKLRELMNLSGMRTKAYNDSMFIFNIVILLPFALVSAYLVRDLCHPSLVFCVYILFAIISVIYAMAFTVFLNNLTVAKTLFVLLWFGAPTLLMFYFCLPLDDESEEIYTLLCCIFAPPSFTVAIFHQICRRYTAVHRKILPPNELFKHLPTLGFLTPGLILMSLVIKLFFTALVLVYIGEIWPWQEGIPKPWHFPISYFFQKKVEPNSVKLDKKSSQYFEAPPAQLKCAVSVENVRMRFTRDVLKGVSLEVYRGQITVLLGHNGAGKTTLMSIMTGLFPPTSGKVIINGFNIETDTEMARKGVGLCPQVNIQYDNLTIEEHLYFFGLLKGCSQNQIASEIDRVLKLLNLENQRYSCPGKISGGMKRKLQLAIAFVGGSTILILDEPSSGLDIETRRVVWDMLLGVREKYVILITTHHMEEADCLGDRIAIMSQGNVICCGTPMFLKKAFGVGYFIRVAKMNSFKSSETEELFKKHLSSVTPFRETSNEVMYTFNKEEAPKLPDLLDEVETAKENIGVASIGISVTSMDDVFLKAGTVFENIDVHDDSKMPTVKEMTKPATPKIVILALVYKRFHNAKRNPFGLLCFLLFVCAVSALFTYIKCDVGKYESNEWQTDINFAAFGYKSAKGICMNHTEFCNEIKQIGNSFSIGFDIKNMSLDELESNISPPILVGIAVEYVNIAENEISQKIKIYVPKSEEYADMVAATIVTNALYSYKTKSKFVFSTANFNPQKTMNVNYIPETGSAILIPIMYLIIGIYPMIYPVMERNTNVKLLQLMTGVSFFQYWLSNLIFDFLQLTFFSLPFFIFIASFYFISNCITVVNSFTTLFLFIAIMAVYFLTTITMSHLLSLFFDGIATVLLMKLAIFIGLIAFFLLPWKPLQDLAKFFMENILPIYPLLGMHSGISNVSLYSNAKQYCTRLISLWPDYCSNKLYFDPDSSAIELCCEDFFKRTVGWKLLLQQLIQVTLCIVFFIAILVVEHMWEVRKKIWFEDTAYTPPKDEDSDVSAMRTKAVEVFKDNQHEQFALSTLNITKRYNPVVVDHLSFLVEPKQCFGLLGVNGAGKTTTFKMLISEVVMTYGESFIENHSVFKDAYEYRKSIGYCPQFDAFVNNLTGREMLYLFARLRGYRGSELKETVENIIKLVDLQDHAKYVADNYSGGNKRKLSIGMSIIGFPRLMFLDEPTAGVDPVARRKVWKIIETCRDTFGSSLILTSHSMDECEHLCSVIAIMVKGAFKCLGSTQHLKTKFGKGVTITLKLDANLKNVDNVKKGVEERLPTAILKDSHTTQLTYHFEDPSVSLGNVFRILESVKEQYKLEDFQVTNSDLEQIFLGFAKQN